MTDDVARGECEHNENGMFAYNKTTTTTRMNELLVMSSGEELPSSILMTVSCDPSLSSRDFRSLKELSAANLF